MPCRAMPCCASDCSFLKLESEEACQQQVYSAKQISRHTKFGHVYCGFKSCFGPADALLNPAMSFTDEFTGKSPLL